MSSQKTALEVRNVRMQFGPVTALIGLSLSIHQGEIHGVVGHNGSGKSTLVEILAGSYVPNAGEMELFGAAVSFPGGDRYRKSYPMGVVHQDVGLVGSMSVVDNFRVNRFEHGWIGNVSWQKERNITRRRLKALGLDIDPKSLVEELSAADQVLISVARALMDLEEIRQRAEYKDQAILILDEPTSSLPAGNIKSFLNTIREINRELGTTVIIVSHNPREIMALSDRFSALKNGRLVGTYVTGEVTYPELAALMSGATEGEATSDGHRNRTQVTTKPDSRSAPKEEVLRVDSLRGVHLKSASFSVFAGEIVGLTGLLGSGYEEIPYLLVGSQAKGGGEVHFKGTKLERCTPKSFRERGGMFLPGDRQLTSGVPTATVRENMTLGHLSPFVHRGVVSHVRERLVVREMMNRLRISPDNPDRKLNEFSGGQQQKSLVGRCLLTNSKLVVIDEPCTGIDVGARNEIHNTLRELAGSGAAVMLTSCQYEELPMVCDRIVVFQGGYVAGELSGDKVTEENILKLCYMDLAGSA